MTELQNIGSFAAYVRRPKPMNTGFIAYFFGENGSDADLITTLSLTQYLNLEVNVTVYLIKDAVGVDKRDPETGHYPIIARFNSVIQRPKPSEAGMTAQFFAGNGENADEVNKLGESSYLDALVYVDLNGKSNTSIQDVNIYKEHELSRQEDIVKNHAWKVSEQEKNTYLAKIKKFTKFNLALHESDLFLNTKLMNIINDLDEEYSFKNFVRKEICVFKKHNHLCQNHSDQILHLDSSDPYSLLPFCKGHYHELCQDYPNIHYEKLDGKEFYLEMKNKTLIKKWVWNFFIKEFSLTGFEEPDSLKIYIWLNEHGLGGLLPEKFKKSALSLAASVTIK